MAYAHLIGKPFQKDATELRYHAKGQGTRTVFLDDRVVAGSPLYAIVRSVEDAHEDQVSHVGAHAHTCDSAFLFMGDGPDLEGLVCEVALGDERYRLESPASVLIPKGLEHSYRFLSGSGYYINIVLAGNYNASLFQKDDTQSI